MAEGLSEGMRHGQRKTSRQDRCKLCTAVLIGRCCYTTRSLSHLQYADRGPKCGENLIRRDCLTLHPIIVAEIL